MSAHFNFTVDTNPMANEIIGVSHHVVGTTTAVVAMQTAVIKAEQQASRRICDNVNRGFYTLIHSQISQKIAKLQSDVDSFLMLMATQTKQLQAIKTKMEHDYRMISTRYAKLFNSLNQNLKQRIFEIDEPIIDFAVKEIGKITNRPLNLIATAPFMQLESLTISQKILGSHIKKRSAKMLYFIHKFLMDSKRQKEITENILNKQKIEIETLQIKTPVAICENIVDSAENKNISVYTPQECLSNFSKSEIKNTAFSKISDIEWKSEAINENIKSEFLKLNSENSNSERVKKLALELFNRNNFQITSGAVK